jgi:hypothetical protein
MQHVYFNRRYDARPAMSEVLKVCRTACVHFLLAINFAYCPFRVVRGGGGRRQEL